jgi:hypothetical protein
VAKAIRKGVDSICALVSRCIQLHRNDVVFRSASVSVSSTISVIDMHLDSWVRAGLVWRACLLGEQRCVMTGSCWPWALYDLSPLIWYDFEKKNYNILVDNPVCYCEILKYFFI